MIRYHARWVLPIAGRPIRDGWVTIDGDRVAAVDTIRPGDSTTSEDLGSVAILPGLVNAHTHLELSFQRGLVPPSDDFVTWIRGVVGSRARETDTARISVAVDRAIEEAICAGTAVVGDISNTLAHFSRLADSPLAGVVFHELFGFAAGDPEGLVKEAWARVTAVPATSRVRASLAAHAPYSVSPRVFQAIRHTVVNASTVPWSVHLSESPAEVEFLSTGAGPWRVLLEEVGAWEPSWSAPKVSPVEYLDSMGVIDRRVLTVHGVQMMKPDLARLAARGATVVTCPRSNEYTGAGVPPIEAFYESGVRVAVGTDSLASCPDLNVFAELEAMRTIAPAIPASVLLDSATRQGARALGFREYGSIEPGQRARLIAVHVPPDVTDVEEYLVSGIHPEQVRWVQ